MTKYILLAIALFVISCTPKAVGTVSPVATPTEVRPTEQPKATATIVATATPTEVVPTVTPVVTVEPTKTPSPTVTPTSLPTAIAFYRVSIREGDTLNIISARCYGLESLWGPIVELTNQYAGVNRYREIVNPDRIYTGYDLAVPREIGNFRNHTCEE